MFWLCIKLARHNLLLSCRPASGAAVRHACVTTRRWQCFLSPHHAHDVNAFCNRLVK